jgi:hypothetical protein
VIWRAFRQPSRAPNTDAWWRTADAVAAAPGGAAIDRLAHDALPHDSTNPAHADEAERQQEMIDGLRALRLLTDQPAVPIVVTQHRVIGADTCHYVAPVTLAGESGAGGKLFLTSARLIFAGVSVTAWPWHRVRDVVRRERDIIVTATGGSALHVQANTFADALCVCFLCGTLRHSPGTGPS